MDYCSLCRRYLNGALACPGCGVPTASTATVPRVGGAGFDGFPTAGGSVHAGAGPSTGAAAESGTESYRVPAREGRAARRRMARWRRRRRTAAGASLAAVALAGGLLTANVLPQSAPAYAHSVAAPVLNSPLDTGHSATASHGGGHRTAPSGAAHHTRGASPRPTTATFKATPINPAPRHHPSSTGPTGPTGSVSHRPVGPTPSPTPPPRTSVAPSAPSSGPSSPSEPTTAPTSAPTPSSAPTPTSRPTTAPTNTPKPVCVLVVCIG